jgi:hypothetical protein
VSAEIVDHPAMRRVPLPDVEKVMAVFETLDPQDGGMFFATAIGALVVVQRQEGTGWSHRGAQATVNGLTIAYLAFGNMLGIPIEGSLAAVLGD